MQHYFTVFGKQIPLYGVFFFVGIILAVLVALYLVKKTRLAKDELLYSAIYAMIGAIVGAKLLFIVVSLEQIIDLFKTYDALLVIESVIKGGFVFYGGLIGGIIGIKIYTSQYKLKTSEYLDIYAVVLPLGHAFGRVGCFFAGCCYGLPYDGPFCHTYTSSAGSTTPLNVPLFPIQLLEALLLFLMFVSLLIVFKRTKYNTTGLCTAIYCIAYSVMRFVLEFFRGDKERGSAFALSTSQWISIIILVIVAICIIKNRKSKQINE